MAAGKYSAIINQSSQLYLNGVAQLFPFKSETFLNGDVQVHLRC